MASIDEVKTVIAQATEAAEQGDSRTRAAIDKLNDAVAQLREATRGSGDPKVDASIGQLERAVRALDGVVSHSSAAMSEAEGYAQVI